MPTIIARGSITITKMDDVYEIKLAPWTISIPTNADGSNPVLSSAKTRLVVNKDNVVISTTITSLTTKNCTATFVGNEVSITGLSADSGEVQINFNVEDQQRIAVFTWTKAKQGSAGTDAYTVSLSNEAHSIPATSTGVVTAAELDKATSTIAAWRGAIPLSSVAANATPGVGQFRYNITGAVGCTAVRVNNSQFKLSAMTADSATVTVSIIVEGVQTIEKVMTISKAKAGQDGSPGAPGTQGPALVPRGAYAANKTYVGTATNIDVVKFNNIWYKAKTNASTFTGIAPTGHAQSAAKWETFGADFESIATDVFFADASTINNLIAEKFRTGTSGVRVEINMNGDAAIRAFNELGSQTFAVVDGKLVATDVDLTGRIDAESGKIGAWSLDDDNTLRAAAVDALFVLYNSGYFAAVGVNVLLATQPDRATARFAQSSNNPLGDNIALRLEASGSSGTSGTQQNLNVGLDVRSGASRHNGAEYQEQVRVIPNQNATLTNDDRYVALWGVGKTITLPARTRKGRVIEIATLAADGSNTITTGGWGMIFAKSYPGNSTNSITLQFSAKFVWDGDNWIVF